MIKGKANGNQKDQKKKIFLFWFFLDQKITFRIFSTRQEKMLTLFFVVTFRFWNFID